MQAARFLGQDRITIVDVPIPTLRADTDVIVKVSCCGLCGSDKRLFHNGAQVIPGHEIAGVVYESGRRAGVTPGTRVIIYIPIFCGSCKFCQAGENNRCQQINGLVGWQRDGGYAEYLCVPAANVIPIPDDIPDTGAVLLLDTVGTAAHAIRLALRRSPSPTASPKALVIGCGPLGLGCILTLRALGITELYASDPVQARLQLAAEFGAAAVEASPGERNGDFGIVLECSGSAPGRKEALYAVEPGGAVVILGESNDPFVITPTPALRRKDFYSIRSFYFGLSEVQENFRLYRENREAFERLVTTVVPFAKLEETFVQFCEGRTIKPFVSMQ